MIAESQAVLVTSVSPLNRPALIYLYICLAIYINMYIIYIYIYIYTHMLNHPKDKNIVLGLAKIVCMIAIVQDFRCIMHMIIVISSLIRMIVCVVVIATVIVTLLVSSYC